MEELEFPKDHYFHFGNYDFEWIYFWGRLSNGQYFHFTEHYTKLGGLINQTVRYSLDGKFHDEVETWKEDKVSGCGYSFGRFSFHTPELQLTFFEKSKPVIHKTQIEDRNYYSIPHLVGKGHLRGEPIGATAWFDHEFSNFKDVPDWDWASVKLDCGINIMAFNCKIEPLCDISINGTTLTSPFILENKHLFIHNLGMYLMLEPLEDEILFEPRLPSKWKYSETPCEVISKGGVIGHGMREKTYRKEKENG